MPVTYAFERALAGTSPRAFILDTDIGGDVDDALAILYSALKKLPLVAVTTSHINPTEKAGIASLLLKESGCDVPFFSGVGWERGSDNAEFMASNPLWPPFFGFPTQSAAGKLWYPNQAKAYEAVYGEDRLKALQSDIQPNAVDVIIAEAQAHDAANPLNIICCGPLHNIEAALRKAPEIAPKLHLWSMGGNYPYGYNWLIAPHITKYVLDSVRTTCISSSFVRDLKFSVTPEEYAALDATKDQSKLQTALMADWENWNKGDKLANDKNLCDPLTLYVAFHPECIATEKRYRVQFPCVDEAGKMKPEFKDSYYLEKGKAGAFITVEPDEAGHVSFVEALTNQTKIKGDILKTICLGLAAKPHYKP